MAVVLLIVFHVVVCAVAGESVLFPLLVLDFLVFFPLVRGKTKTRRSRPQGRDGEGHQKISCPHCGSPVQTKGDTWECGWCGDSGRRN